MVKMAFGQNSHAVELVSQITWECHGSPRLIGRFTLRLSVPIHPLLFVLYTLPTKRGQYKLV